LEPPMTKARLPFKPKSMTRFSTKE
jgi:hypothetical protein